MLLAPLFLGLVFGAAEEASFETIRLQSGFVVQGEVLKERPDILVVDVGIDVVKIPKDKILSRSKGKDALKAASATNGREYGDSGYLYSTAELPQSSIKDLVNQFGEAVVLVKTPSGLGSGFIIDENGHCVTNCHVVEGETRITVDMFLKSGNSISERTIRDVEIVALSPFYDLALLRIPQQKDFKFKQTYFGFAEDIRQGDVVFAIGNPRGLSRSVTEGIISNKNRNVGGQVYLQTTTQINPGNSGGPLFNIRGQVIGVTNMKILASEGLGFAIPINYVKDFLRNREAFAYNKDNPNTGYRYLDPPRRLNPSPPPTAASK